MANPNFIQLLGPNGLPINGTVPQVGDKEMGTLVSELHGRFYQEAYQGKQFRGGMTVTSINNATFTSATVGATATPIIGIWNPNNSGVIAEILQAVLTIVLTALQNTGGGPFVWMISTGNTANPSTGAKGFNTKSWVQNSACQNMAGVALTGLSNNLAFVDASAVGGGSVYNIAELDTAAGFMPVQEPSVGNVDGSILVPPGVVLALMATTTPVGHSAAGGLLWNENPL